MKTAVSNEKSQENIRSQDEPDSNGTIGSLSAIGRDGRNETGRDDETSQDQHWTNQGLERLQHDAMSASTTARLARLTLYSGSNCSLCDVRTT
jgi:hypothetical protein